MDEAVERRAFGLYEELLALAPADRDARLDETSFTEPALHAAVKAMFAADARGHLLLPTIPPSPRPPAGEELPMPERIGPFRLVSEIGRGGMGVVYRAERDDGLYEQRVAIKLIRSTLFSERALAQFAIERRILAKLHHPHIAQMLEGGITADGASYIVMELVEGAPITDYADAARLALGGRLDLFGQVATAIEHAHRNLVVHADIKPNNVVVCEGFGVKLLDFGISRLLSATDEAGNAAYTPGFGSPARQAGLPSTPADDIYALGVLLRALIGEAAGVDGDLTAIVDHACAADPHRRYGTVGALMDDIARWRRRKPVSARPASKARLTRLFWRRHRLAVSLAAIALVVVLATTIATTLLWRRAETARAAAVQRFEETRALSRYLIDDVTTAIAPLPGSSPVQEQIAEHAEQALERLARVPGASPDVRADSAAASARVGGILAGLDQRTTADPLAAERALARAEGELRRLIAMRPDRTDLRLLLAKTLVSKANFIAITRNDIAGAFRVLDEADRLTDGLPPSQAARDMRWEADLMRAEAYDREGRFAPIPPLLLPTLRRVAAAPPPRTAEGVLRLSQSWIAFGDARYYLGDQPGALAAYRRALAALSDPAFATDVRVVLRIIYSEFNLSSTLSEMGRKPEALVEAERGVVQARRLRSFDDTPKARHMSNIAELEYATELAANHRFDEAIAVARAGVAGREALARLEPGSYDAQRAVPVGMRPLAEILRDAGRRDESCTVARETDARWAALARRWALNGYDGGPERAIVTKLVAACGKV